VRKVLGLLENAVMAQGLKGARALFQKIVNEVSVGLRLVQVRIHHRADVLHLILARWLRTWKILQ
jgi:hypothetical protein